MDRPPALLLVAALALFVAPSTPIAHTLGGGSRTPLSIAHVDSSGGAQQDQHARPDEGRPNHAAPS